jgi:RNA polymerase sigma-54 factor
MSMLSPRLQLRVQQKQILTPGLVQMVTVLQLNRLELKEMISQEVAQNPVLEESIDGGEELTPAEIQSLLEAERVGSGDAESITEVTSQVVAESLAGNAYENEGALNYETDAPAPAAGEAVDAEPAAKTETDPFDQIDFGSFFDDYLDPGYKSPAGENYEKPSFETFLSSPTTLTSHLNEQLSLVVMTPVQREAADAVVGNLDENGYLMSPLDEIAVAEHLSMADMEAGLKIVQSCDPAGVAARDLQECLLLQLASRNGEGGVAWQIVSKHLKLLETKNWRELARVTGRPVEHIEIAVKIIRTLDPQPGLRFSSEAVRSVEPDVYIVKDGEDWVIEMNDEDLPQLRLNTQYRHMIEKDSEPSKEVRNYVKERFTSALMLLKNIEQRKQTILKVCQAIVGRQQEFLEHGLEHLKPMMIKDVAEEIGVHPSTVSRAVASKYAHTPQGVHELRYFFSEAVQGPSGSATPLLLLKRKVKKMIDEEDSANPLTDDQITARLQSEGIQVTRRTVAKYREDLKIPSTHQRRVRN